MNEITIWKADFIYWQSFYSLLNKMGIDKKYWDKISVIKFKLDKGYVVELYNKDMEAIKQGGNNV